MQTKTFMRAAMTAIVLAAATFPTIMKASAQTIPGIPDSELAKAHVTKGCNLVGAGSNVQRIFGSYALALSGSGHIPQTFFPGGAPATANMGAGGAGSIVWWTQPRTLCWFGTKPIRAVT